MHTLYSSNSKLYFLNLYHHRRNMDILNQAANPVMLQLFLTGIRKMIQETRNMCFRISGLPLMKLLNSSVQCESRQREQAHQLTWLQYNKILPIKIDYKLMCLLSNTLPSPMIGEFFLQEKGFISLKKGQPKSRLVHRLI